MKPKLALLIPAIMVIFLSTSAAAENSKVSESDTTGSPITSELETLRNKAYKGDADAQFSLGSKFYDGEGVPKDSAKAFEWYQKAADQGHASAQSSLGMMYAAGHGVPKDYAKAADWLQRAAMQGDAIAQSLLGAMYEEGLGVPKDAAKSVEWHQKSAAQNYSLSQYQIGLLYYFGVNNVPQNFVLAYAWLNLAAAQGLEEAKDYSNRLEQQLTPSQRAEGQRLATNWKKGDTLQVENQIVTALPITSDSNSDLDAQTKKARNGDPIAQFDLGMMYDNGDGVPKDAARAVEWWLKAAAQGYADAQHNLGLAYSTGEGVTRDRVRAYAWFNLAAAQGDMSAKDNLDKLEAQVSPAQRAEAQRISSSWKIGDTFKKIRNIPDSIVQVPSAANNTEPAQKNANGSASWKSLHKANGAEYFIDTSSIRKADGLTHAWEKIEINTIDKNNTKVWKTVLISNLVNCNNHTLAGSSMTVIDKNENGDAVNTQSHDIDKPKYHAALPDSPSDKLVNFVCAAPVAAPAGGSSKSSGSGFFVSSSGYLLTNNHVVNGCAILKIRDSSKIEHDVTVVATDAKSDLALLKTNKSATFPIATFHANGSVESGESVVALGYPLAGMLASEVNVSFGYVSATAGLADDTSKLQISAPVQPGNSGGPLLDQAGNLIGVVVAKLDAIKVAKAIGDIPQNINFAVKGEVAQVFLKAHKVKFKTATAIKKLENTDIASRGRAFTVLVECYK